jgi:hypothetical protein
LRAMTKVALCLDKISESQIASHGNVAAWGMESSKLTS